MAKAPNTDDTHVDRIGQLTADITDAEPGVLARLRGLIAAAKEAFAEDARPSVMSREASVSLSEEEREAIRPARLTGADRRNPPLRVVRVDERDDLIEARIAGPVTALAESERLGPFVVDGGSVFFEIYRPVRRFEVTESGAPAPAFVLTSARRPAFGTTGPLTLDLQPGTVWIRGDLLGGGLPAGAYAGITVDDGKLTLASPLTVGDDSVEVSAPMDATLTLKLATSAAAAAEGGCRSDAAVTLPDLTLEFGAAGLQIEGGRGEAEAYGLSFRFDAPTGGVHFIAPLWTLVLGYSVSPEAFDGSMVNAGLADFDGEVAVKKGGLGLPVVVANPAILGAASVAPGWWLEIEGLQARWYKPDERFHRLAGWMGINGAGVTLFSPATTALVPALAATYRLWALAEAAPKRVPWRQSYDKQFLFFYRCDAAAGEDLLTTGAVKAQFDRPVQVSGVPVDTPTTNGVMHQRKAGEETRITLGALIGEADENQLALRNALIWATRALGAIAQGTLTGRTSIDEGTTHLFFGVLAWAPTLPDPYVANFQLCRPAIEKPRALMAARIDWRVPSAPRLEFTGNLGAPVVCDKTESVPKPVAPPATDLNPDVGPTQTEQDKQYLTKEETAERQAAQQRELRSRPKRVAAAEKANADAQAAIDGYVDEVLGRMPPVLLLDVSTNQDLLGVALWGAKAQRSQIMLGSTSVPGPVGSAVTTVPPSLSNFPVQALDVHTPVEALRLVTLPQIQWEPVRTLDADQNVDLFGWFPTPLASATDGGATVLGTRWEKLAPVIPEYVLDGTRDAFDAGKDVVFKTTLPFGLIAVVRVDPGDDDYGLSRPDFPTDNARGGLQITARAEGGATPASGLSPFFDGRTRQLINGIDLASGLPLGLSVLGSEGDPDSDVEEIFNNDMAANPKVPVTRFDISGYGGSNFSDWQNPFAAFAETSKAQFQVVVGRTALEIIKVSSVLHPWGIRVTRSITVERRSGGGVVRRDSGWQASTPGLFDYRYVKDPETAPDTITVPDYAVDAGIFRGLFNVRAIRPAPGGKISEGAASFVPYYFDADLSLEGMPGTTHALGVLGWLQTEPNGEPADKEAIAKLVETQGPIGGPIDTWIDFGASDMPFRARRIEVGLAGTAADPTFVATVRGVPRFPKTGAWSVVRRDLQGLPPGGGEAVPVPDSRGVPIIRRYAVKYAENKSDQTLPRDFGVSLGAHRFADAADLLTPAAPKSEYGVLQSTPTHAFLFPRPYSNSASQKRVRSDQPPEFADVIARSTSKGAFPPPENAIRLSAPMHFTVSSGGKLQLSDEVRIDNHATPLRISGSEGHGSELRYDRANLRLNINSDSWDARFTGLRLWSDIAEIKELSGAELKIDGSTTQRPQITEIKTLVHETVDEIMTYLPIFGAREPLGPVALGASNAKHEIKIDFAIEDDVPKDGWPIGIGTIKLKLGAGGSIGFNAETGAIEDTGKLTAGLKGEIQLGTTPFYVVIELTVTFTIASASGAVTKEKLDLLAFVGVGVRGRIGGFKAYAYLGVGFVMSYDLLENTPKYGGMVRLEAGIDLKILELKVTAELQGLVYKGEPEEEEGAALPSPEPAPEVTKCDYSGKVKVQVDIFLIISISATYTVSDTKDFE